MRTAATVPDRVGAGASFHGGNLVNDQPTSPHLLIPKIRAKYMFAVGRDDEARDPQAPGVLKAAFEAVKNPADIEVYKADHGWCVIDSKKYDEPEAERAWAKLLALYKKNLA
jgi:carboxymethylenebutenolidase